MDFAVFYQCYISYSSNKPRVISEEQIVSVFSYAIKVIFNQKITS
jgi:hypothetical protein